MDKSKEDCGWKCHEKFRCEMFPVNSFERDLCMLKKGDCIGNQCGYEPLKFLSAIFSTGKKKE